MNNNLEKLYHIKFRCVSVCESIKGTDIVHVNVIPTILWDDNLEELTYILDANDEKYEVVMEKDVLAIYNGKWKNAGKTMKYVRSEQGFLLVVVIPTAIFLVFEAFVLVTNIMKIKQEKVASEKAKEHEEELAKAKLELEAEKEKIRAQVLAELEAKKNEKQE